MAKHLAAERVKTWRIKHASHGELIITAPDEERAIISAAQLWKVPWTKIAALCDIAYLGAGTKCLCARCRKWFPATIRERYCPACAKQIQKDAAQFAYQRKNAERTEEERERRERLQK